jgi:hypothetical protein
MEIIIKKAFLGLALIISSVIHPITYNTTLLFNPTTKHKVAILSDALMNDESSEELAEIVDEQNMDSPEFIFRSAI